MMPTPTPPTPSTSSTSTPILNVFDHMMRHSAGSEPVRYAITFGEDGAFPTPPTREGFTPTELHDIKALLCSTYGVRADVYELNEALAGSTNGADLVENRAALLVVRGGLDALMEDGSRIADSLLCEQRRCVYKTQHDNRTRDQLKKRRSRDVHHFDAADLSGNFPHLSRFRDALPKWLGEKARNLAPKANRYHAIDGGIGFHGDVERNRVVCLTLGASMVLRYKWLAPADEIGPLGMMDIRLFHGDIYVMSEKATGYDWHNEAVLRVVHAAGSRKYIG